jgi:type VI secretion system secreted protein Hcp
MAQVDYFLKISGIDGESQDDKHKGEIDVLSFSWGISNSGNAKAHGSGGGSGAGRANIQDFSIVKFLDTASPQLFEAACTGDHFPEATFTIARGGDVPQDFYKIKLTDVLIALVQPAGSAGADSFPMEQVSFSFGSALISSFSQDPKGGIGKEVSTVLCGGSKR